MWYQKKTSEITAELNQLRAAEGLKHPFTHISQEQLEKRVSNWNKQVLIDQEKALESKNNFERAKEEERQLKRDYDLVFSKLSKLRKK